jgi:hypothetical protein
MAASLRSRIGRLEKVVAPAVPVVVPPIADLVPKAGAIAGRMIVVPATGATADLVRKVARPAALVANVVSKSPKSISKN